ALSVNMPGVPTGVQFTFALPSSRSTLVKLLYFASAHGWNGIGSSLTRCSGTTLHALAFPVGPGNQTPDRSTWPSDIFGGGPPGGSGTGTTLPRACTNGFSCALAAIGRAASDASITPTYIFMVISTAWCRRFLPRPDRHAGWCHPR